MFAFFHPVVHLADLIWQRRQLLAHLVRRELSDRYAGQAFGSTWVLIHPISVVLVYVFIFEFVFKARLDFEDIPRGYTAYIVAGLLPWLALQDALTRSATAISANPVLIRQIVFPTEMLVLRGVFAAGTTQIITTALFLAYLLVLGGGIPMTALWLPVLLVSQMMLAAGLGFIVAACGVFFRDTKDFIQFFFLFGVYLAPVVYLPTWVPGPVVPVLFANPFSYMIWNYQDVLFFGQALHPFAWFAFPINGIATLIVGSLMFRSVKHQFPNLV